MPQASQAWLIRELVRARPITNTTSAGSFIFAANQSALSLQSPARVASVTAGGVGVTGSRMMYRKW